ncbi:hypothetical protein KAFR_0J00400 [Kazachstania africana CBS 2517]|uniref:Mediator of RNA polymerase II transcription subunit 20 n=1 Tax=Kazachstania africana (strain ATCC 22294 / BCRC 22015 / CBS 2517 / CECT 1963 / NBRC 1671 / NRRL Y-8276) TaxID=1071382 RepID=H2B0F8_KAZAF|nr:hypothetical protein KAFR_0J00400 [Kazachstania africana CBS 2517]CCF60108.1 hypothetical protein KAFR_0J00400 [Kazachstania africana CBS 2517]
MSSTTVIFIERATLATLSEFKDVLANILLSIGESWSVEVRPYRARISTTESSDFGKLMYSITFPSHDQKTVIIKDQKFALVTTSNVKNVSNDLLENNCTSGFIDSMDSILTNKLSNIWDQRQLIRGESGETFITKLKSTIKAINLFSSTGFKGLLIEIDTTHADEVQEVKDILKNIGIKDYQICQDSMDETNPNYICDLAYQYVKVLEY